MKTRLPRNLKALREHRNYTQQQLADRAQLHVTAISQLECGRHLPSIVNLVRLSLALRCSADALLTEDNPIEGLTT